MKSVKEELEDFRKALAERSPQNFNPLEFGGTAKEFLPSGMATGLEPLPKRDYDEELEQAKLESLKDLNHMANIYIKDKYFINHNIIKKQIEIDSDLAGRYKHLILVEQSKMHEVMNQMDLFPAEIPFHTILVKIQERLSLSIDTYDNFLKKCGLNYKKISDTLEIEIDTDTNTNIDLSNKPSNHKGMNKIIADILKSREPK